LPLPLGRWRRLSGRISSLPGIVCCHQTLQVSDAWFYEAGLSVRPLSELVDVYHHTVGQNAVLELDFAINPEVGPAPFLIPIHECFGLPSLRGCITDLGVQSPCLFQRSDHIESLVSKPTQE
jgi:hypothetical protein